MGVSAKGWSNAIARAALWSLLALLLGGCASNQASVLEPRGPAAQQLATLWWVLFWTAVATFIVVLVLLGVALFRPRRAGGSLIGDGRWFIGIGGALIPTLVLVGVMVMTSSVQYANATPETALTVQVVGHQWWWEVNYPGQQFATANELHVPVGQPVLLKITSADVIHSFWVPELQAKMDLIPGQTNTTWIQADRAGVYRGECTEFCGLQHAQMGFMVVAEPPEQFQAWLAQQQQPAAEVTDAQILEGRQIFLGSACVYCHMVRGTNASGKIGPDLTHIASRQTIGAGVLPNNRGNLAGWIVNAQAIKPGNRMPPMYLDAESLQAVVAYMESLK